MLTLSVTHQKDCSIVVLMHNFKSWKGRFTASGYEWALDADDARKLNGLGLSINDVIRLLPSAEALSDIREVISTHLTQDEEE